MLPLNCLDKKYFKDQLLKIQNGKEILCIITSFVIDIKQYNMYDELSLNVMNELQETINTKSVMFKMPYITVALITFRVHVKYL